MLFTRADVLYFGQKFRRSRYLIKEKYLNREDLLQLIKVILDTDFFSVALFPITKLANHLRVNYRVIVS